MKVYINVEGEDEKEVVQNLAYAFYKQRERTLEEWEEYLSTIVQIRKENTTL